MIKNTDLRIGNLILGVSDRIEKVVAIGENYCYTQISTMPSHTQEWVDVNGIPLTEDWLLKLGFENGKFIDLFPNFSRSQLCLNTNNDGQYFISIECEDYFYNENETPRVWYVHQLQNLYFALTGQELQLTT